MKVDYGSVGFAVKNKCERIVLNNPGLETFKKNKETLIEKN